MSLPPLSATQRGAVQRDLGDALVVAGAGSGKTRVLTERFVHVVRATPVSMRRLAALTFTEKAAAQMRERIAALFREVGDEALRADVEFAPIGTIHSFCAQLLRQHAVEAGVDPAFQVLDAVEAGLLREDAAVLAEQRLEVERPELAEMLQVIAGDGRTALLSLLERLRGNGCALQAVEWMHAGADVGAAAAAVPEALEAYAAAGGELPEALHPAHADVLVRVAEALSQVHDCDLDASPFVAARAQAAVVALKGRYPRAYNSARKALDAAMSDLTAALLDQWGQRVLSPALRELLGVYDAAYAELKRERSALDFTDLELGARDLLRRDHTAGRGPDLLPEALLVDEYQDTNPLQAEILDMLRAQAPQFSVGDPKQSIYRFRRADVGVILRERERVGADGTVAMNASYRAHPALVAGVNALNQRLFADGRAGVAYEPLEAAATFLPADGPLLEFGLIDAGPGADAASAREREAAWIAERIETLTAGTTPRLAPVRDAEGRATAESLGALARGDVAILFRAGTNLAIYESALEARGIPYLTQKSAGYFQAEEITDLIHLLRAVHNPDDRFALACTATGPAMGARDDDLLRWFAPGDGSAWERMQAEADADGPYAPVVATLHELRVEAAGGSLARAVERALVELGLYETALMLPAGDRRAANLRKAVELARRLDRGGRRGLADLLRHLATLRDREMGESEAPIGGEVDDVVRLTTVHGAKGLEYPVVFVADVGRGVRGSAPTIHYDGGRRVAARVEDPLEGTSLRPAGYDLIDEREKAEDAQEAQRLLYVAMTRAEERLVLSGWCKGAKKNGGPSYLTGWGGDIWDVLDMPLEPGIRDTAVDDAGIRVHVIDGPTMRLPAAVDAPTLAVEPAPEALREAERLWRGATVHVAPLGHTRFVVSVSDLLTFAESPQRYYVERVLLAGVRAAGTEAWDAPGPESDPHEDPGNPDAARRSERVETWDEQSASGAPGRAAIGRAVHAVIAALAARDEVVPEAALDTAVLEEGGDTTFGRHVAAMTERFLASPTGIRMRAALAAGGDVRREVALHARIRFPGGEPVAGLDSLLVKGSIDLWLPTADGVLLVDHKTNLRGARFRAPEDLAAHYAWQLRLYVLATERVLGADVAGAYLLLLDPSWGPEALEVPVDIGGTQLEETRRLCRAFAIAELEGRYPEDWRTLLPDPNATG